MVKFVPFSFVNRFFGELLTSPDDFFCPEDEGLDFSIGASELLFTLDCCSGCGNNFFGLFCLVFFGVNGGRFFFVRCFGRPGDLFGRFGSDLWNVRSESVDFSFSAKNI